jgi:hypothetical protein
MRHPNSQRRHSIKPTSVIVGVAFNPVTSKWSSFWENTWKVLSEHRSEAEAHAACRRYEATLCRRMNARRIGQAFPWRHDGLGPLVVRQLAACGRT